MYVDRRQLRANCGNDRVQLLLQGLVIVHIISPG
jgi:hypothetical protein